VIEPFATKHITKMQYVQNNPKEAQQYAADEIDDPSERKHENVNENVSKTKKKGIRSDASSA
jgi:hypothetical protein